VIISSAEEVIENLSRIRVRPKSGYDFDNSFGDKSVQQLNVESSDETSTNPSVIINNNVKENNNKLNSDSSVIAINESKCELISLKNNLFSEKLDKNNENNTKDIMKDKNRHKIKSIPEQSSDKFGNTCLNPEYTRILENIQADLAHGNDPDHPIDYLDISLTNNYCENSGSSQLSFKALITNIKT